MKPVQSKLIVSATSMLGAVMIVATLGPGLATRAFGDTSAQDIFRIRVFDEPLVPIGGEPGADENAALAGAMGDYSKRKSPDDFSSLTGFAEKHPQSAWNAALLTSLGTEYYNTAHYSLAMETWAKAWSLMKDAKGAKAKALADRAAGELAFMYARLGRMEELGALLKSVEGRTFIGPATEKISGAREGLWNMQHRPEISFRCGPLALHRIKAVTGPSAEADMAIHNSASTQRGMSLPQVVELSKKIGLNYQMAFRQKGAAFMVPSVIHWNVGHYAAMTKREGTRFLLQDPTFGNDAWATTNALESEASGYFLIPSGALPNGWRPVDTKEGEKIWGKGVTSNNDPKGHTPQDPKSAPCSSGILGLGNLGLGNLGPGLRRVLGANSGMAGSSVHLMLVNLNITDTPVGYGAPVGPAVAFTVRYNHREAFQPSTFTYANFGSKWTCDWISYITDNPQSPSADVNFYVPGGGTRTFSGYDTNAQRFSPQRYDQNRLARTSAQSYEIVEPDGSKMIFSRSDGASGTSRKIFLTQIIDPSSNVVTLNYDASLRLTNIVDAIGQATTLSYSNATDSLKITRVTDPFGRFADFQYDSSGRLTNITDVIGIKSRFIYEGSGDFINALVTPYGTTSFTRGSSGTTRWLETLYPDGSKERVEFNQDSNLGIPFSEPAASVPQGMSTFNQWLYARNTYFWSRTACATAYGDYSKAKIYHWLHEIDLSMTSGMLESIKEPLEGRVWFSYPGQSSVLSVGAVNKPRQIGRVLDDSSTQLHTYDYNEFGHVTNSVDPLGRTFSYIYSTNGIDLLQVRMTRAGKNELLFSATYNAQHLPLTQTDAAGQTTTNTYNARGQLLATSNPKGETTTYTYNTNGYPIAVDGPLPGTNDTSRATYDALGRAQSQTEIDGHTTTAEFDALDRVTRIIHPDGTFDQFTYERLEPTVQRDRAGRLTLMEYDTIGNLIKRTDPQARVTRYDWCRCGQLKSLTDQMGRTTHWEMDVQGRVVRKQFGDGTQLTYSYEAVGGRLRQLIDEKAQVTHFSYNIDDTLRAMNYVNAPLPTPAVTYRYDPDYKRTATMTDGNGVTTYSYNSIGTPLPGAGFLASIDGPWPNDTITFGYDPLGRRVTTAINGVANNKTFDTLSRLVAETNILGASSYGYSGASSLLRSRTFPSLATTNSFGTENEDLELVKISHRVGATPISEFTYERDLLAGRITSWSQQIGAQAPSLHRFSYDGADQLVSVTVSNSGVLANQFAYAYDPTGNRLREVAGGVTNVATYNALNQISVSSGNGSTRTNEWDAKSRLLAVNDGPRRTEFSYDGLSRLSTIRHVTNGAEASFRRFLWVEGELSEERNAAHQVVKRFFPQGVSIESGPNAGVYFYTRDHLGSIRELIDSNGVVRKRYAYDPFGRRTSIEGDVEADFGFAGMFWSVEVNLNLTWFRAYDPEQGRWLSRDPLPEAELNEGANLYTYVGNNPINGVDPLGLCCEDEKFAAGLTFNSIVACQSAGDAAHAQCDQAREDDPSTATQRCAGFYNQAKRYCDGLNAADRRIVDAYLECKRNCNAPKPLGCAGISGGRLGKLPPMGANLGPGGPSGLGTFFRKIADQQKCQQLRQFLPSFAVSYSPPCH